MIKNLQNSPDLSVISLNKIYNDYASTLYGLILRIIKDEFMAEEALAECFLTVKKRYNQFTGEKEKLLCWLVQIARQVALKKITSKEYRYQLLANTLYKCRLYHREQEPTGLYDDGMNIDVPFSNESKVILDLLFFEGLTIEQIALKQGLTSEQVKNKISEAVRLLKEEARL